jgi:hypothetical protein
MCNPSEWCDNVQGEESMLEQDGALSSVTQAEDAKWGSGIGMPSMTLPLGFHVPLALKEKIWRGEFIELGLLLEGSGAINWDNSSFGEQGMLSLSAKGLICYAPKQSRKIESLEQWTDAFTVFMAIFCTRHPGKSQELLKYMSVVRNAARQFSTAGAINYDEEFRKRQSYLVNRSWMILDGELWHTTLLAGGWHNHNLARGSPSIVGGANAPSRDGAVWPSPHRPVEDVRQVTFQLQASSFKINKHRVKK